MSLAPITSPSLGCPSTYLMPQDWDVVGQLPPKKRLSTIYRRKESPAAEVNLLNHSISSDFGVVICNKLQYFKRPKLKGWLESSGMQTTNRWWQKISIFKLINFELTDCRQSMYLQKSRALTDNNNFWITSLHKLKPSDARPSPCLGRNESQRALIWLATNLAANCILFTYSSSDLAFGERKKTKIKETWKKRWNSN